MTTELRPTVQIDRRYFRTGIKHGMELWWSDSTPKKRLDRRGGRDGFTRYVNARVEGKLAEVAFMVFLDEYYDIESAVDWRVYGDYDRTDYGDLRYIVGDDGEHYAPAIDFDLKKTKPWNSWLALRDSVYERHGPDDPFILCLLDLHEDVDLDEYESYNEWPSGMEFEQRLQAYEEEHFPLDVEIAGTVYKDEFTDHFEAGDSLYDPNNPDYKFNDTLRMDNYGVPVQDLVCTTARWNRVVDQIVGDSPVYWDPL